MFALQVHYLYFTFFLGLYHSIYGTSVFKVASIDFENRNEVQLLIGKKAEQLAYIFCTFNRNALKTINGPPYKLSRHDDPNEITVVDVNTLKDLYAITIINELEQLPLERRHKLYHRAIYFLKQIIILQELYITTVNNYYVVKTPTLNTIY